MDEVYSQSLMNYSVAEQCFRFAINCLPSTQKEYGNLLRRIIEKYQTALLTQDSLVKRLHKDYQRIIGRNNIKFFRLQEEYEKMSKKVVTESDFLS